MSSKRSEQSARRLRETTVIMADLLHQHPEHLDRETHHHGANLVGIFEDQVTSLARFPNAVELKKEVLLMAVEDISYGLMVMCTSILGLSIYDNKLKIFTQTHGTLPEGTTVFSIAWKNLVAFKRWRWDSEEEVSQEDINAAIYFLSQYYAQILGRSEPTKKETEK